MSKLDKTVKAILAGAGLLMVSGGAYLAYTEAIDLTTGAEPAMFGNTPSRNMVSDAKNLPATWDADTGEGIVWQQALGSQSYGGPVLAGDILFVGTNNEEPRDQRFEGDKGVLMAFRASDGEFLWQAVHHKLPDGKLHDWPLQGICSGPYVEGDRIYYVSNRAELVAADAYGFRDGENDGPFQDEEVKGPGDVDILWKLDMIGDLDVFPHNLAAGNPLVVGDLVFTVTGNGVDEGHILVPSPFAPSLIAVNKHTGELVWEDASPGPKILHGSWSNPAYGVIGGQPTIVYPSGDGVLRAFEPETGKKLWEFDCNPKDSKWELGGAGTRNNVISTPVVHDGLVYIAVGQDPEHGEGPGNLWVIDAAGKSGELGQDAVVWHRGGEDYKRTISTVAVHDGLVYAADLSGFLYALDAKTGEHHWTYDAFAAIWGSPFVADGKVYLGDEDGDIAVLQAGKELKVLAEINMGTAVYTTPVAEDGRIYLASRKRLFALDGSAVEASAKTTGSE